MIRAKHIISALIILGAVFTALAGHRVYADASEQAAPDAVVYTDDYLIGPEDVLKVTVWDNDDLTAEVKVGLDGVLSYKFIGRLQAAGLTVSELEERISGLLSGGFIKDPQVSVQVVSYKSKKVFILGEVNKPGTYYLNRRTTLVEAISMAQGITKDADTEVTIVRRSLASLSNSTSPLAASSLAIANTVAIDNAPGFSNTLGVGLSNSNAVIVDLRKALEGELSQNITVMDEDSIYVPKAKTFFIMGEVNKPGQYKLERDTTVLKAISIGGGHTIKAALNRTTISRTVDGKKVEKEVALDEMVQPFDTIQVPQSYF